MAVALKQAAEATQEYSTVRRTAALAAVLLSAAALRCFRLGATSLWLDETFRVSLARMNAHDFLRGVLHPYGANSAAYHLLLRFWLVLGSSETVLDIRYCSAASSPSSRPLRNGDLVRVTSQSSSSGMNSGTSGTKLRKRCRIA